MLGRDRQVDARLSSDILSSIQICLKAAARRPAHVARARSGGPMTTESPTTDRDYPQLLGERGLIEPAPRRVRGYFDQALVFDTTRAHYVWEIAYYPQYYIRTFDVRMEYLHDENHVQKLQFGSSRLYSLTSPERTW